MQRTITSRRGKTKKSLSYLWRVVLAAAFLFAGPTLKAQTIKSASCAAADVKSALAAVAADNTTVSIPAGDCVWTNGSDGNGLTYNLVYSTTIQCAGAEYSGYPSSTPVGSNITIIEDGMNYNAAGAGEMFVVNVPAGKNLRITACAFIYSTSNTTYQYHGSIQINGASQSVRFDHNYLKLAVAYLQVNGAINGVVDHNQFDLVGPNTYNAVQAYNGVTGYNGDPGQGSQQGVGNYSWADGPHFGTANFLYVESNTFNASPTAFGAVNDCSEGGRQVIRYNTILGEDFTQTHEGAGDYRGCRAIEIYGNTAQVGPNPTTDQFAFFLQTRMGTGLVWGNTTTGYETLANFALDRGENPETSGHQFPFPPNGLGYCGTTTWSGVVSTYGTTVTWSSGFQFLEAGQQITTGAPITINGVTYIVSGYNSATSLTLTTSAGNQNSVAYSMKSAWDGNTDMYGYPCYDQPGRGKSDLIAGFFPQKYDTKDPGIYSGVWPNEASEPYYVWGNTYNPAPQNGNDALASSEAVQIAENRDYYLSLPNYLEPATFNGTAGVGSGLLSARPSTCTTQVGYWATDTNTLYQCVTTNTWTAYYPPYSYPHPLTLGSGVAPPTGLQATFQ